MGILEAIVNGGNLAIRSFDVLRKDKELLLFPVLSAVSLLVALAVFVLPLYALLGSDGVQRIIDDETTEVQVWKVLYVFCLYFIIAFVTIFFNTAMVGAVLLRLNGYDPTVGDGLRIAFARLGAIFGWALLAATVDMLLRILEGDRKKFSLGRILAPMLAHAWALMAFLVVPVLVVEGLGPIAALSRSAELLRKTWGEQIVGNVGLAALFTLIGGMGIILILAFGEVTGLWYIALPVLVLFVILTAMVCETLGAIYRASVYHFAVAKPLPSAMDRDLVASAFVPVRE
jgi:hypothetical protein